MFRPSIEEVELFKKIRYYRRKHYYEDKIPVFVIISEDYNYNLQAFGNYTDVIVLKPATPIDDMCILINSDELILSASSFSWWSGYLNGGPVVISALVARKNSPIALKHDRDYYLPIWLVM